MTEDIITIISALIAIAAMLRVDREAAQVILIEEIEKIGGGK